MRREQLEHLIRAAAAVSGEREIVIVGAAAILGAVPDAPAELTQTMEADLYPLNAPGLADIIDGAIGSGAVALGGAALTITGSFPVPRTARAGRTGGLPGRAGTDRGLARCASPDNR